MINSSLYLVNNPAETTPPYSLILDDDPLVCKLIEKILGMPTLAFKDSKELLAKATELTPKAVFIDIHLPDGSGLDLIPKLRERWPYTPFIVITADLDESKISHALSLGADDFLHKPIRTTELKARLQKRWEDNSQKQSSSILNYEDITLDTAHANLKGPKTSRNVSPTELNLLSRLIQAQGTSVSRSSLKFSCWQQINVSENALDRKIYETRKALSDVGSSLELMTLYGEGFKLAKKELPS